MTTELGPFSLDEEWPRPKGCVCRTLRHAQGCENRCDESLYRVSPRRLAFGVVDVVAVSVGVVLAGVGLTCFLFIHF